MISVASHFSSHGSFAVPSLRLICILYWIPFHFFLAAAAPAVPSYPYRNPNGNLGKLNASWRKRVRQSETKANAKGNVEKPQNTSMIRLQWRMISPTISVSYE